jgi:hypothetical protein
MEWTGLLSALCAAGRDTYLPTAFRGNCLPGQFRRDSHHRKIWTVTRLGASHRSCTAQQAHAKPTHDDGTTPR